MLIPVSIGRDPDKLFFSDNLAITSENTINQSQTLEQTFESGETKSYLVGKGAKRFYYGGETDDPVAVRLLETKLDSLVGTVQPVVFRPVGNDYPITFDRPRNMIVYAVKLSAPRVLFNRPIPSKRIWTMELRYDSEITDENLTGVLPSLTTPVPVASLITSTSATVTWAAIANATSYSWLITGTPPNPNDPTYLHSGTVDTNRVDLTGLPSGTTLQISVTAKADGYAPTTSAPYSFSTLAA